MLHEPFYDPLKSYEDNYKNGPFSVFTNPQKLASENKPKNIFFNNPLNLPFGIPAGPLLNGRFVKAALDMGFDLPVYKTVRTSDYPCHPWPNVIGIEFDGDLTLEKSRAGLISKNIYNEPLSITNSFGVPSYDPTIWQKDMSDVVNYAKEGQLVIGSFQGTRRDGKSESFIADYVLAAKLVKETGAKVLEANFSCPNEGINNLVCFDIETVRKITEAIKKEIGDTPLIIKMAYFENEKHLSDMIKNVGNIANGISAINTIPSAVRKEDGQQALPGEGRLLSGVCGNAIRWAGLDMTKRLKNLRDELDMQYTIIGVGGVSTFEDYTKYIEAGADAVMSATGAMWNPYLAQEIKNIKL